jgi:nitrogen fixation protein NifB
VRNGNNLEPGKNKNICRHPCFNNYDYHNAIIHLPVAAECNLSCNYGMHKSCCSGTLNRDAAGTLLTPYEAIERYKEARKKIPNLTVAAIAGPGEPLANFEEVKETLRLLRQSYPETNLCLSTNGLMLPVYATHLISLGVNYITVNLNAINPDTGAKLYNYITYLGHKYTGVEGANILLQNQIAGISYLASRGISVRLNIAVIKGINDQELKDIAYMAKETGCKMINIIQHIPNKDGIVLETETFEKEELNELRRECEKIIPLSYYCKTCSAATVETLNTRLSFDFKEYADYFDARLNKPPSLSCRIAVCSKNGRLIDEHFGHAAKFYIYDYKDEVITFVETRPIEQYSHGTKEEKAAGKVYKLIRAIEDCNCVVALRIGVCPSNALKEKSIDIYTTYNLIEDGIREAVLRLYTCPPL